MGFTQRVHLDKFNKGSPERFNDKNRKLLNDYLIVEQIGSGSFGEVYLAQYKEGGYVAVKVEEKRKVQRVYNEYKIYKELHDKNFVVGLPKIYDYLQSEDYNILVMQLLGPSLEDLFNKEGRLFTLPTVYLLAIQLVTLLEKLHNSGFIHRDIKPNNFLIGRDKGASQVFMMDFGLSKRYVEDGKHMKMRNGRSLIGTARYASVNMHMGFEPSRRDDLESVGYMLIYFLKGALPWQGIKKRKKHRQVELIGDAKMCTSVENLCGDLPSCFMNYIKYCRKLKFTDTPDYEYLRNLFVESAKGRNIVPEFIWSSKDYSIKHNDLEDKK
ncbi:MAG: serine/threonine protein kinase [Barrevirus sp.]|uniref:non-specific serine/threonine protein kinase n=1 Tax=Barrevirus sp. TaxID=2487763 RepID=A0A3G4ZTW6_9VIRU|nr:MAG: serine/threonine protein kinase [Barrevirus sp.]